MNDALRNIALLVWAVCAINNPSIAQANVVTIGEEVSPTSSAPTVIYGASKKSPTESDAVIVEQGANDPNPFGDPIVTPEDMENSQDTLAVSPKETEPQDKVTAKTEAKPVVSETSQQNPKISPENSPQKVNEEIQNTLYESGDRIYDVQSYPIKDIDKITEPNTQPTVTDYPSY